MDQETKEQSASQEETRRRYCSGHTLSRECRRGSADQRDALPHLC